MNDTKVLDEIFSSQFKDIQEIKNMESGISYQTMTMETWNYLVKRYGIKE